MTGWKWGRQHYWFGSAFWCKVSSVRCICKISTCSSICLVLKPLLPCFFSPSLWHLSTIVASTLPTVSHSAQGHYARKLLNDLMEDYSNALRPVEDTDEALNVSLQITLSQIKDMVSGLQTYVFHQHRYDFKLWNDKQHTKPSQCRCCTNMSVHACTHICSVQWTYFKYPDVIEGQH